MNMITIEDIPKIIIEETLSYIEYDELLKLRLVNRRLNLFITPMVLHYFEFNHNDDLEASKSYLIKNQKHIKSLFLFMKFPKMKELIHYLPNLIKLDIASPKAKIIQETLEEVNSIQSQLKSLSVTLLEYGTINSDLLIKFDHLVAFHYDNSFCTDAQLRDILEKLPSKYIKKLLIMVNTMTPSTIKFISEKFIGLNTLKISGMYSLITSTEVFDLPYLTELKTFHFIYLINDQTLKSLIRINQECFPKLKQLRIDLHSLSGYIMPNILGNWEELTHLSITKIDKNFVENISKQIPNLNELELAYLNENVELLNTLLYSLGNLKKLTLIHVNLPINFLNFKDLPKIEHLNFHMVTFTDGHLFTYLVNFRNSIHSLTLDECKIPEEALKILNELPSDIYFCNLRTIVIKDIQKSVINWLLNKACNISEESKKDLIKMLNNE